MHVRVLHMHIHTHTHTYTYTYIYIYTYAYTYTCTCTCTFTYTFIVDNTHTHSVSLHSLLWFAGQLSAQQAERLETSGDDWQSFSWNDLDCTHTCKTCEDEPHVMCNVKYTQLGCTCKVHPTMSWLFSRRRKLGNGWALMTDSRRKQKRAKSQRTFREDAVLFLSVYLDETIARAWGNRVLAFATHMHTLMNSAFSSVLALFLGIRSDPNLQSSLGQ